MRAAAIMQLTMFVFMYLSTAQMPMPLLQGWLHDVAGINPMTNILRHARQGLVSQENVGYLAWNNTWGGIVAIVLMASLTLTFARRGLNKLDR